MGSSAALTTSLVGALLHALCVVDVGAIGQEKIIGRQIVHNLAQLAHCIAQGKIGSGFDVSAAVFGSQIYSRFDPKKFNLDEDSASGKRLFEAVTDATRWTHATDKFSLPKGMRLIMADVCGGSSSSSMARGVLAWRTKCPDFATPIWSNLAAANVAIRDCAVLLHQLSAMHKITYEVVVDYARTYNFNDLSDIAIKDHKHKLSALVPESSLEAAQSVWSALIDLKKQFGIARSLLREMGECSGQDIEPLQQRV